MRIYSTEACLHVISEPGDGTKYDFLVYRDGPDNFFITAAGGTLEYPQRLNIHDARVITEADEDELHVQARGEGIDPFTLLEVCRTVIDIHDNS
jgi:hypothetical protein